MTSGPVERLVLLLAEAAGMPDEQARRVLLAVIRGVDEPVWREAWRDGANRNGPYADDDQSPATSSSPAWGALLDEYDEALISWRELDHTARPRYEALRARIEAALAGADDDDEPPASSTSPAAAAGGELVCRGAICTAEPCVYRAAGECWPARAPKVGS